MISDYNKHVGKWVTGMNTRVLISMLLASGMIYMPGEAYSAEKRKTLFEVLFKKANQNRLKKSQKIKVTPVIPEVTSAGTNKKNKKVKVAAKQKKKLPKIESTKNFVYQVAKRAPILLVAAPINLALAERNSDLAPDETIKVSPMTADILNAGKFQMRAEAHLAKTVSDYYNENQRYLWINEEGEWNAKANAVIELLGRAEEYGLNPADYEIEYPIEADDTDRKVFSKSKIKREIALSTALLRYAMDARHGSINPNLLSGYHDFPEQISKAPELFEQIVESPFVLHSLQALHPSNEKFAALRKELSSLREAQDDSIKLDPNTFLRPGNSHSELPNVVMAIQQRGSAALLEKHSDTLAEFVGNLEYDKRLVSLVRDFQKEAGLSPDGIIGRNTIARLAGVSNEEKVEKLLLAMERMRWHPDQFGERHVFINQPEYIARYIEDGKEALSMRIVVGKKSNQTNFFYDEIEHVTFNPYWGVPRSIIVNEFTPKSISNPAYLDQKGYELRTWGGKKISASNVNWSKVGTNPQFSVRQKPGPQNALGSLKIMFPNKHAIYMHDTPAKNLFNKDYRAYSHGCVRLHDPQAMAAAVLGKNKSYVNSRIAPGENKTEKLQVKVPVYVSYFTAWPQEDGTVKYFADMYERDEHLLKAIEATRKARTASLSS